MLEWWRKCENVSVQHLVHPKEKKKRKRGGGGGGKEGPGILARWNSSAMKILPKLFHLPQFMHIVNIDTQKMFWIPTEIFWTA